MRFLALTVAVLGSWLVPSFAQFASEQSRREALQHYRNGHELMSAEQFEKAVDQFTKAINKDNLLTLAHHGLGEAYMALRRYPSAIVAFTKCREAFLTLHGLRERDRVDVERQRDEEIRELNDAIRRLRAVPNTNLRVAKLEARVQDLQRQRTSNSASFQSPPELSLALGSAYFRNEQLSEAEREWKEALIVNPRMGEAHNNLAALYAVTQRKKEAEEAIRQAEGAGFRVNPRLKEDIRNLPN